MLRFEHKKLRNMKFPAHVRFHESLLIFPLSSVLAQSYFCGIHFSFLSIENFFSSTSKLFIPFPSSAFFSITGESHNCSRAEESFRLLVIFLWQSIVETMIAEVVLKAFENSCQSEQVKREILISELYRSHDFVIQSTDSIYLTCCCHQHYHHFVFCSRSAEIYVQWQSLAYSRGLQFHELPSLSFVTRSIHPQPSTGFCSGNDLLSIVYVSKP